jgi:DNA polymerase III delta subunit
VKIDEVLGKTPKASVYFLYGKDLFSKWQFRKKLERSSELPSVVVFGDDLELFEKAECSGLIPEPKLVIVNDFSEIKNKKAFYDLIERAPEEAVYLLFSDKKEKVTLTKTLLEIDCPEIKQNEKDFIATVKGWLKNASFSLNDQAIKKIYWITQGDLFQAFNEVQKISMYAHATNSAHVSADELKTLVGPRVEIDPFIFSTYYLQKKLALALNELSAWKNSDVMLQLHNQFKAVEKALLVKTCKNKGMKTEKIMEETGVPLWYLKYSFPEFESKWSEKDLIAALKDCTMAIHKARKVSNLAIPMMVESVLRRCKFSESVE